MGSFCAARRRREAISRGRRRNVGTTFRAAPRSSRVDETSYAAFAPSHGPVVSKISVKPSQRTGIVGSAQNVVLLGPVSTGQTHLAIGIGMACCQQERRVRFTTAAEL